MASDTSVDILVTARNTVSYGHLEFVEASFKPLFHTAKSSLVANCEVCCVIVTTMNCFRSSISAVSMWLGIVALTALDQGLYLVVGQVLRAA